MSTHLLSYITHPPAQGGSGGAAGAGGKQPTTSGQWEGVGVGADGVRRLASGAGAAKRTAAGAFSEQHGGPQCGRCGRRWSKVGPPVAGANAAMVTARLAPPALHTTTAKRRQASAGRQIHFRPLRQRAATARTLGGSRRANARRQRKFPSAVRLGTKD
ncbi:hypothetical protein ACP70R_046554 [Stipagrostis hirtigluma subsp. patula]